MSEHIEDKELNEEMHEHHHGGHEHCCGHDHEEHEHKHGGHEHCCGHDHEGHEHHDHGHKYDVPGYNLVETHVHEGATVCSFERDTKMEPDAAKSAMEEAMLELETWLNSQGAIIGHVKGYIKNNGPSTTFSTVGAGLNILSHEAAGASVGFASIVFGPDEETMKDKVIDCFSRLK